MGRCHGRVPDSRDKTVGGPQVNVSQPLTDCGPEGRHFVSSFNVFSSSPSARWIMKFQGGGDVGEVLGGTREISVNHLTSAEHLR